MSAAITREDLEAGRVDLAEVIDLEAERLPPVNPGRILREEFLRPLRLSAATVAASIGVPRNRLTEIINGRRAITADTALRLGIYFGTSAEFWLSLQARHDLHQARRTIGERRQRGITPLRRVK